MAFSWADAASDSDVDDSLPPLMGLAANDSRSSAASAGGRITFGTLDMELDNSKVGGRRACGGCAGRALAHALLLLWPTLVACAGRNQPVFPHCTSACLC